MTPQDDERVAQIAASLKQVLTELDVRLAAEDIEDTTPLFEEGLGLDSFAIVDLIGLIETRFGFEFSDTDLRPEAFKDVITLARIVARSARMPH